MSMRSGKRAFQQFLILVALASAGMAHAAEDCARGPLQVASPDWRDQVIYFAMIDRFDDGDPRNNDQGTGEYDPADGASYSGGDLVGLTRRIEYMRGLGATALWVTPPVANQWWDGQVGYGGYHGYWAENFKAIDAHFGTLEDYRHLSRCLHARGMVLVQDIVVNHVGNFFHYDGDIDPKDPARNYRLNADSRPHAAPTQVPFSLNDPRRDEDRKAAIYHWTPRIRDFSDRSQQLDWQLAELDDLNTESPVVRKALRDSYGYWIREAGVDAYRVDTAFYVPPEYFDDFLNARDAKAPGILRVARASGHKDFHLFGEGFGIDAPYADTEARRIDSYMRDAKGRPLLPGMINFPLYGSTLDVFAKGQPSAVLAHRIRNMMSVHADPHRMPSFVDNHDVERFLAGGSEAGLRQSLLLIMTLPGIPVIYYGTEQGFSKQRAAMFATGVDSGGRDHFDVDAPLYRYIGRITKLRREHRVLSRGSPTVLAANAASAGALAYRMQDGKDNMLVVFNSAEHESLLADLDTGLAAGTRLAPEFSIDGEARPLVVGDNGRLSLRLPARSGQVWSVLADKATLPARAKAQPAVHIEALPATKVRGDLSLQGTAEGIDELLLVIDGNLERAQRVAVAEDGRWHATLDTADLIDPEIEHAVIAWPESASASSASLSFRVDRQWTLLRDVEDAAGDDHGPGGNYLYPADPFWNKHHPLDLRGVRVLTSGSSLRVVLRMHELVAEWNPVNGFDHLAVTLFIELPANTVGSATMPLQNASLPEGMRWNVRLRAGGWSNSLFRADGASATNEGRQVSPVADLKVDRANNSLAFTIPASALGNPQSLSGARLFVTTWDYDGGYRPLQAKPDHHRFGGATGDADPLVMDASAVITLP
jgi:glycosidase